MTGLYDLQRTTCHRDDILGIIPEERLPEWAKEGLESAVERMKDIRRRIEERGER